MLPGRTPQGALGPLLYTLEFQLQFPHFAQVLHFLKVELLVDLHFLAAKVGDLGDGHDQYDHGEHRKRNEKW
jgi:hypothetical protein